MILDISTISLGARAHYLQHAIGPRPICFASTVDEKGQVNLSPFSFFNLFSLNPPVCIFSPSRSGRDNSTKHTLENVLEVPEVVIQMLDYDMVQQASLASCEYPRGINEFVKAGFTQEPATLVRPPMVRESKIKMECRVLEVKQLGDLPGSGNLVLCEILRMHIDDSLLTDTGRMDQKKISLVARLGGDWYCRVDPSNLFEVEKPMTHLGAGVDALPVAIRESRVLTGNNLGQLANLSSVPEVDPAFSDERLRSIVQYYSHDPAELEGELHRYARQLLEEGKVREAWQVLLT
jgi:flavin reductase (DIM6/NTAB) family NADH-FMN oxidoreductase RutF